MLVKDFAKETCFSKGTGSKVLKADSIENVTTILKLADFCRKI